MSENLADRLDAVERALTDGDADLTEIRERAALSDDVDRLETRVEELEAQVEELDAALEAVRGYAGNVRAVNREVERRASAALAKAEAIETAVDGTVDAEVDVARGETAAGGGGRPGPGSGTGDRSAHRPADTSAADEFDWGLDDRVDGDGLPAESMPTDDTDAVGRGGNQPGGRDTSSRRSRAGSRSRAGATGARAGVDGTDRGDDEESGTEQFIERVRDAL